MKKEIFRAGKWTDGSGNTRDWSEADLDSIAKTFSEATGRNTDGHEVPLTPGHPKDDTPALGVVKRIWREGKSLWAEFMDIKDEVVSLIKDKTFRDVSIALKNGVLRHVGLTNIPAVPGLTAFKFADGDFETWEFSAEDEEGLFKRFRNWLLNNPTAGQVKLFQQENDMEKIQELENKFTALEAKFTAQADELTTLKADKEKLEAEKANIEKKFSDAETELKTLKAATAAATEKALDASDAAFAEEMIKEGRLVPAQKEVTLMTLKALRGQAEQEFTEGVKQTPSEHYRFVLKNSPKVVEFGQYFTGDKAMAKGEDKLDVLTKKKLSEMQQTDVYATYAQAADVVMQLHPELLKGE